MVQAKVVDGQNSTMEQKPTVSGKDPVDRSFFLSRLHSLTGIFLVLFLIEHLLTNSQAALWLGDDGTGFVDMVNWIHSLPYLKAIEIGLLAVPFAIHMWWGVLYLRQGSSNSRIIPHSMHRPRLPLARGISYSWQRITAWLLLVGVIGHVLHMRILSHPMDLGTHQYGLQVEMDPGLYTLAPRLGIEIYTLDKIEHELQKLSEKQQNHQMLDSSILEQAAASSQYNELLAQEKAFEQSLQISREKLHRVTSLLIGKSSNAVILATPDFGTAALMLVREAFKSTTMCWLYTFYVLAAVFHACNGLWTAGIVWGWTPSVAGQNVSMLISRLLMIKLAVLGLCAIWLTNFNLQV